MAYARFAPQTDVPWRTYDVSDKSHVVILRDGGPQETTRRKFRSLSWRVFKWNMPFRTNVGTAADQRHVIDAFLVQARTFSLDPFLVHDPKDARETDLNIGTGDGVKTVFYLPTTRTLEQFRHFPYDDSTTIVQDAGVTIATANRTINTDARKVTLVAAPAVGHAVTISYDWYRLVMFDDDSIDWSAPSAIYADTAPNFTEILRDG